MRVRSRGFGRFSLIVAWLFAAAALADALHYVATASPPFADLQVYRLALHHLSSGGAGLYDARAGNGAPFTYPPVAAMLLAPLGALSTTAAGAVMTALSLAALVAVAYWCRRSPERSLGAWLPLLLALALVSVPVRNVLFFGQVGLLLLLLVAVDVLDVTPRRWRGAFVGVAAAVKLTPFVFVPLLWFSGRRRDAVVASATAVGLWAVAAVALPHASRSYWTGVGWHTSRVGDVDGPRNRSLWGLIGHGHAPGEVLLAVACAAVLATAYTRGARAIRDGSNVAALAIGGMASVAVSPISWSHHLTWVVPAEAVLLTPARSWLLAAIVVLTYRLPVGSAHVLAVMQASAALIVVAMLPTKSAGVPVVQRHRPTVVGMAGFEPTTSSSRTRRATKLRHIPVVRRRV